MEDTGNKKEQENGNNAWIYIELNTTQSNDNVNIHIKYKNNLLFKKSLINQLLDFFNNFERFYDC